MRIVGGFSGPCWRIVFGALDYFSCSFGGLLVVFLYTFRGIFGVDVFSVELF